MSFYITITANVQLYKKRERKSEVIFTFSVNEEIQFLKKSIENGVEWWYVEAKNENLRGYIDWKRERANLRECLCVRLVEFEYLTLLDKSKVRLEEGTKGYIMREHGSLMKFRTTEDQVGWLKADTKFSVASTFAEKSLMYISLIFGGLIAANYMTSLERGFLYIEIIVVFFISTFVIFLGLLLLKSIGASIFKNNSLKE